MKNNNNRISFTDAFAKFGKKNLVASLLVIVFFVALIVVYYVNMTASMRESIISDGELNAVQSADRFDRYLTTGMDSIKSASHMIDSMLRDGRSNEDILAYMTQQSDCIIAAIDEHFTGLYGYIRGEYLDGVGWVPDEDYVPTERPWYIIGRQYNGEIALVEPYLDAQTGTVMMTLSKQLSDGESVVSFDIDLGKVQEMTEEAAIENSELRVILLDDAGGVVAHSDKELLGHNFLKEKGTLGSEIAAKLFGSTDQTFELAYGGKSYIVYSVQIESGWYCISVIDSGNVLAPLKILFAVTVLVVIITIAILCTIFANIITKNSIAEKLGLQLATASEIYMTAHDLDLINDTFSEICVNDKKISDYIGSNRTNMREMFRKVVDEFTDAATRNVITEFTDLDTLEKRLGKANTITTEFLNYDNKWCRGRFIVSERTADGRLSHVLFMTEQIDEEKRSRDKLRYLSETDGMTGVCNRAGGEHKIRELLSSVRGGMFVLLDADKFKNINDSCGHSAGDKVLIAIAYCMKRAFRSSDVVMRLGGDEFAAFAQDIYEEKTGREVMNRLFENLHAVRIPELGGRTISVSVGAVFCKSEDDPTFEALYKCADECTYTSKEHDGNFVVFRHFDGKK